MASELEPELRGEIVMQQTLFWNVWSPGFLTEIIAISLWVECMKLAHTSSTYVVASGNMPSVGLPLVQGQEAWW